MLILASGSLARRRLLQGARIPHRIIVSGVDEDLFSNSDPSELVKELSMAKVNSVLQKGLVNNWVEFIAQNEIQAILGCDSVFVFEGEVFGKPSSAKEAFNRLKKLSSNSGYLFTGHNLHLIQNDLRTKDDIEEITHINEVIITKVTFSQISDYEIEEYISTGAPLNSAGGFSLEWKSGIFIESIEGCISNVLGLSLPWLKKSLVKANIQI